MADHISDEEVRAALDEFAALGEPGERAQDEFARHILFAVRLFLVQEGELDAADALACATRRMVQRKKDQRDRENGS